MNTPGSMITLKTIKVQDIEEEEVEPLVLRTTGVEQEVQEGDVEEAASDHLVADDGVKDGDGIVDVHEIVESAVHEAENGNVVADDEVEDGTEIVDIHDQVVESAATEAENGNVVADDEPGDRNAHEDDGMKPNQPARPMDHEKTSDIYINRRVGNVKLLVTLTAAGKPSTISTKISAATSPSQTFDDLKSLCKFMSSEWEEFEPCVVNRFISVLPVQSFSHEREPRPHVFDTINEKGEYNDFIRHCEDNAKLTAVWVEVQ